MEKFRREPMRIELYFTCVSEQYFDDNLRDYYEFLSCKCVRSKEHGSCFKNFYKRKEFNSVILMGGLDIDFYYTLPGFVCASKIY